MDAANIQPHEALGVRTRLLITMIEVFKKAGMDLKQLEYFVRVAELGNFTRAAQALDVVQPALSRQVRRLEPRWSIGRTSMLLGCWQRQ